MEAAETQPRAVGQLSLAVALNRDLLRLAPADRRYSQFHHARGGRHIVALLEETIATIIERGVHVDHRLGLLLRLWVCDPHSRYPVQRIARVERAFLLDQLLLKVQTFDGERKRQLAHAYGVLSRRVVDVELVLDHGFGRVTRFDLHTPGVAAAGQEVADEDGQQPDVNGVRAEPVPDAALGEDRGPIARLGHTRSEAQLARRGDRALGQMLAAELRKLDLLFELLRHRKSR